MSKTNATGISLGVALATESAVGETLRMARAE